MFWIVFFIVKKMKNGNEGSFPISSFGKSEREHEEWPKRKMGKVCTMGVVFPMAGGSVTLRIISSYRFASRRCSCCMAVTSTERLTISPSVRHESPKQRTIYSGVPSATPRAIACPHDGSILIAVTVAALDKRMPHTG